ncbi:hypothetical protein MNBD_GAMMA06-957 [hydrothermal vent metagenome]|uniref:TonB-dependent receptor n=1 Tax=hydrothermal vent metagenome TaxID=652676 RepID=A0A3B0WJ93_9ZZZZ
MSHSLLVHAQNEKLHVLIDDGELDSEVGGVDKETTSSSYSVIEAERLRNSFISLPEVLEQEVGVQTLTTGGVGSFSSVVLRGASSEQVVIYLDGVPLNNASGGAVDLGLIALDKVERIEIYRGSTPLELGSPSIGGAVNIITRQSIETSSNVAASVASFDTYKLSGSTSFAKQKNRFYIGTSYLQSKNDFSYSNDNGTPANPADDRVEKRRNDGVKHLSALANWKYKLDKNIDTEIRLDVSDRNKKLPGITNSSAIQTFVDTQDYNFLAQINARKVVIDNLNFNAKVFYRQKDELFDDSLAQTGFFNQRTQSVTKKAGVQTYAEILQTKQQWKFLTSYSYETYDTESSIAAVQSDINTRKKLEASAESVSYMDDQRFIISLVIRYQSLLDGIASTTDEFARIEPGFEKKYKFINPQFGFKYRLSKRTFLTANIGQYNRAPSFFELFGGSGLLLGNVDLKQEKSINTDVGYTYTWFKPYSWLHDTELYGGVFYNKVSDLIVRIFNGQGIGVPRNISDAVIQGVETTLKLMPSPRHTVTANASLIDSVNNSEVIAFQNKELPGYYRKNFALRYAYTLKQWIYSFEMNLKRETFYDRANLLKGDDVNLLNSGIRYLFKSSNIDFRINNILDENTQYFRNRPTPGLNISLTYNASF